MKHKHAELMAQYAQDAMTTNKPWELWEIISSPRLGWMPLICSPMWLEGNQYRRKPKTNEQLACELLEKAHAELEAHSAEICEPNVDHIQKLVWDAMQLLSKENNNEN